LNVLLEQQTNATSKPRDTVWTVSRDQRNRWYFALVPINYAIDYKVIFEGVAGNSIYGEIVRSSLKKIS
jgi:hypothetical protein